MKRNGMAKHLRRTVDNENKGSPGFDSSALFPSAHPWEKDMANATSCDDLLQLNPQQQAAVDLLLAGKNDRETAEAVEVHRTTVSRWRLYHPAFQAELNRRRKELYGGAVERLRSLLPKALDAIERELTEGDNPTAAALNIIKLAGLDKLGAPVGPVEAEGVIEQRVRRRQHEQRNESTDAMLNAIGCGEELVTEETVKEELRSRLAVPLGPAQTKGR